MAAVERAEASGISLQEGDAATVKGMLNRGDRQHDIAAWFGVNGGRVADIKTGKKFAQVTMAPESALPPPGPYLAGKEAHQALKALEVTSSLEILRQRMKSLAEAIPEETE